MNRHFQAKHINICILLKLLHWFQSNNYTRWWIPSNTRRWWSKHAHNKFKMEDGRHFPKNRDISATVWPINCTKCCIMMHILTLLAVTYTYKFQSLKSKMANERNFEKSLNRHNSATILLRRIATVWRHTLTLLNRATGNLTVCHTSEPCKKGWTDLDPVWVEDSGGPKEARVRWGPDPTCEGAIIREKDMHGHARRHSVVSCANTAEPIDSPFVLWTRVGRRKHKYNHIHQVAPTCPHGRAHWRHLANAIELSASAMRPYVKLLWPLVIIRNKLIIVCILFTCRLIDWLIE